MADRGNGRVQVFSPTGRLITLFGNFEYCRGVCVDVQGQILVSDESNCVSVFGFVDPDLSMKF